MARMYYALQSVQHNSTPLYGIQSIGASSAGNVTPIFQLGMQGLYGSYSSDDEPIEITISKQLDGRPLIYDTLTGGANDRIQFNFWTAAGEASGGNNDGQTDKSLVMPKYKVSSVSYTFDVDGVGTEEVTIIGDGLTADNTLTRALMSSSIVSPADLATRARVKQINGGSPQGYQSVTFTYNLNLENLYTLGKFTAEERYSPGPSETTIEFVESVEYMEAMGSSAAETIGGCTQTAIGGGSPKSIELCDGTKISVLKAVSTSTSYAGGGTDGSPLLKTSSWTAYDDFAVVGP